MIDYVTSRHTRDDAGGMTSTATRSSLVRWGARARASTARNARARDGRATMIRPRAREPRGDDERASPDAVDADARRRDERARALEAASERARGDAVWARMAGYDWLSAGMGSCLCAGYFVWRGDDAGASLVIAATATIAAVVFEEVMRDGGW